MFVVCLHFQALLHRCRKVAAIKSHVFDIRIARGRGSGWWGGHPWEGARSAEPWLGKWWLGHIANGLPFQYHNDNVNVQDYLQQPTHTTLNTLRFDLHCTTIYKSYDHPLPGMVPNLHRIQGRHSNPGCRQSNFSTSAWSSFSLSGHIPQLPALAISPHPRPIPAHAMKIRLCAAKFR